MTGARESEGVPEETSVTDLSHEYSISRRTTRKRIKRYEEVGPEVSLDPGASSTLEEPVLRTVKYFHSEVQNADVTCGRTELQALLSGPPETRLRLAQRSGPTLWSMGDLPPGI